jgi:hypothetical protein
MTDNLRALWQLTEIKFDSDAPKWNGYFDPIGLILHGQLENPENYSYWCTPRNSITFGSTGGDGVHYGILDIGSGFTDSSPVVMTVPSCDTPNTIVGASFVDFLALGCRQGYFTLEQLIYQREMQIAALDSQDFSPYSTEDQRNMLESITHRFELLPWEDHTDRLDQLQRQYFHHVDAETELE